MKKLKIFVLPALMLLLMGTFCLAVDTDNHQSTKKEQNVARLNKRVSRRIALSYDVWRIEGAGAVTDLNLSLLFEHPKIIAGASPLRLGSGELFPAVVEGKLNNSRAIRKGLHTLGKAILVASGGGIVMNGESFPVSILKRKLRKTENGDTVNITDTGFMMTVVPDISKDGRLVLRCVVNQREPDAPEPATIGDSIQWTPKISELNFSRETALKAGQTLVLGGFINAENRRDLLIVTIATEKADAI
jgi:hypothetical protein